MFTRKNWKLILNYNTTERETIYFDRFTKKILDKLEHNKNYILLSYHNFIGQYIMNNYKLDNNEKDIVLKDYTIYC